MKTRLALVFAKPQAPAPATSLVPAGVSHDELEMRAVSNAYVSSWSRVNFGDGVTFAFERTYEQNMAPKSPEVREALKFLWNLEAVYDDTHRRLRDRENLTPNQAVLLADSEINARMKTPKGILTLADVNAIANRMMQILPGGITAPKLPGVVLALSNP